MQPRDDDDLADRGHDGSLLEALLRLESVDEAGRFLRDLCTLGELRDMAQRWAVVRLLDAGLHYAEISQRTARAPRRSPGSPRGSTTARAATGRCSTQLDAAPRRRTPLPRRGVER